MKDRLKKIEKELLEIYSEMQKEIPALNHLSFEVGTYNSGGTYLSGFYHIGEDCEQYENIIDLVDPIEIAKARREKNAILYQRFEGVV